MNSESFHKQETLGKMKFPSSLRPLKGPGYYYLVRAVRKLDFRIRF